MDIFGDTTHATIKAETVKHYDAPVSFGPDDYWTEDEDARFGAYQSMGARCEDAPCCGCC
jgi:hypothetical protein